MRRVIDLKDLVLLGVVVARSLKHVVITVSPEQRRRDIKGCLDNVRNSRGAGYRLKDWNPGSIDLFP